MNFKHLISFFVLFALFRFTLISKSWQPLDKGFNNTVRVLFADTIENAIFAGGYFDVGYPGIQNYPQFVAKWNDSLVIWDTVKKIEIYPGSFISAITKFQNKLFVGGNYGYLFIFDGVNWDSIPIRDKDSIDYPYNIGTIWGLYNYNNEALYVLGRFDGIGGKPYTDIAKFDGTNWSGLPYLESFALNDAIMYKGKLYVGGNMVGNTNMEDIARFNFSANQWETVGGGTACDCWVNKFYIYHDTLIVAGYFQSLGGQPFNNIAMWDGDNWIDVDGGLMPSNVWGLAEYDNYLYACGQISWLPNNTPINRMAKWDGQQWTDAGFSFSGTGATPVPLAVLNNDIYIGGGFIKFNGDTVNNIVKYSAPLNIDENIKITAITINPNPFTNSFTIIQPTEQTAAIIIYNLFGRKIFQSTINNQSSTINFSNHPNGIYFLTANINQQMQTFKILKQ